MGLHLRIIVHVSKNHPVLVLYESKTSRLNGIPPSCRNPASPGCFFSYNQTWKFRINDHNNEVLLKRPIPGRRDKVSFITSPLKVFGIFFCQIIPFQTEQLLFIIIVKTILNFLAFWLFSVIIPSWLSFANNIIAWWFFAHALLQRGRSLGYFLSP